MADIEDQDKSNVDMLISTDYIADTEGQDQDRNIDIDNGINDNDALSLSELTTNTRDPTPILPKRAADDIHHETVNNGNGEGGKEEENMRTEAEEKEVVKEDDYEKAYEHDYKVYQKSTCKSSDLSFAFADDVVKVTNKQGTCERKQEQEYRFDSSSKKNMGLMEGGEENSRQWDVLWKVMRMSSVLLNGMVVGWWVYSYLS